jgi:N-methylhydantoinase A/oxoprolinase/acetone carboxylase beta subunit
MVGAVSILEEATVAYFNHLERLRIGPSTAGPVPYGEIFRASIKDRPDKNLHFNL